MAKGNMFQGMARGKVGDVVFSRTNGEQISRVRNRHPNNPRTNKQMYQRAVMATVMQAYSAGKEIFDHAFQGKAVGAENQRVFLSKNAKLLRGQIASELAAGTTALNCSAAVVAPGAITPVPNAYMISEGTYPQNFFDWNDTGKVYTIPNVSGAETVAQYASRNNLVAGDIYTFVAIVIASSTPSFTVRGVETATTGDYKPESQYPAVFAFLRLQVKDVSAVATAASAATLGTFFEVTAAKNAKSSFVELEPSQDFNLSDLISGTAFPAIIDGLGTLGVIRSRLDEDLRSTSFMNICSPVSSRATAGMYGITTPLVNAAWKQGTENLGDSDLILEGGDE